MEIEKKKRNESKGGWGERKWMYVWEDEDYKRQIKEINSIPFLKMHPWSLQIRSAVMLVSPVSITELPNC